MLCREEAQEMKFAWLLMRALRWLLWAGFLGYSLHYVLYSASHLDRFGHLLPTTEMAMYGLSLAAVFAGLMELLLRDRAGVTRGDPPPAGTLGR
jgi:hypothetical protein